MRLWSGIRAGALALAVSLTAGCTDPGGPIEQQRYLGVLQLTDYVGPGPAGESTERDPDQRWSEEPDDRAVVPPQVIAVPADGVEAGTPFEITTYTVGGGCTVADGQEVQISANVVELKPFDRELGEICTMQLVFVPHTSTLTLDTPGEWVVRVTGRKVRYQDTSWELPISAETTITVR